MRNLCYELEAFYDGACPICLREVKLLKRLDRQNRIQFTDISSPNFKAEVYSKTQQQFMQEMHARLPDGTWVTGVEVFRRLYSAVGFRWLVWPSRLPGISQGLNYLYRIFAKKRLSLTGRCQNQDSSCSISSHKAEV
ncbi:thiol-disulfide oxidoreductase DCC family protein [Gimesia algae]|uniref:DUF393 domain-containing protein n=1 Tax=Gimesia algae TaxID=2527971 RepID=A0A517VAQ7_9PLAN|nr:DUF393 domain-containing protein [Gimesia algae]QDT90078.1 hypothetical protein Pan161_17230 [Gimesia algae]